MTPLFKVVNGRAPGGGGSLRFSHEADEALPAGISGAIVRAAPLLCGGEGAPWLAEWLPCDGLLGMEMAGSGGYKSGVLSRSVAVWP